MLLQWSAPEYMPHSFQVSGLSGTVGHKQTGNCFDLTKQVADGFCGYAGVIQRTVFGSV